MQIETIKIICGALALRRFTIRSLAEYTGSNANTVATVLRREAGYFESDSESDVAGLGKGRPRKQYRLRVDAAERIVGMLSTLPLADLRAAGTAQPAWPDPLDDVMNRAERFLSRHLEEPEEPERVESWIWFEDSMRALQKHLASVRDEGLGIDDAARIRLTRLQRQLSGGIQPLAAGSEDDFFSSVMEMARYCVSEFSLRPLLQTRQFADLVRNRAVGKAAASMGLLAAIGVASKLPKTAKSVQAELSLVAQDVDEDIYGEGLDLLLRYARSGAGRTDAFPVVVAGIRQQPRILHCNAVTGVLVSAKPSRSWPSAVRGAYLLAMQGLPLQELNFWDMSSEMTSEEAGIPRISNEVSSFAQGVNSALREAVEYDGRFPRAVISPDEGDQPTKFEVLFGSAAWHR